MRPILAFTVVLGLATCRQENSVLKEAPDNDGRKEGETREQNAAYEEVWMMRGWQGHMSVVLGLKAGVFHYWFYSDQGTEVYWAKGYYSKRSDGIRLIHVNDKWVDDPESPAPYAILGRNFVRNDSLYANRWRYVSEDGEVFLASEEDLDHSRDSGRWLRRVDPQLFDKHFPSSGPFLLHMNPDMR